MGCRAPAQGTDTECAGARLHERMAPSHCSSLYSPGHNQSSLSLGAGMAAYSLGMWPKSALSRGIFLTCPAMQNWKHSRAWALAELGFRCGAGQPRSAQPLGRGLVVLLSQHALPCGKLCPPTKCPLPHDAENPLLPAVAVGDTEQGCSPGHCLGHPGWWPMVCHRPSRTAGPVTSLWSTNTGLGVQHSAVGPESG